jgi:hypothetical protein
MRPDTVIDIFPFLYSRVQVSDIPWNLIDFIKLLRMSPMSPLHTPIELWTLWR